MCIIPHYPVPQVDRRFLRGLLLYGRSDQESLTINYYLLTTPKVPYVVGLNNRNRQDVSSGFNIINYIMYQKQNKMFQ